MCETTAGQDGELSEGFCESVAAAESRGRTGGQRGGGAEDGFPVAYDGSPGCSTGRKMAEGSAT